MAVLVVLVVTVLLAAGLLKYYPRATKRWLNRWMLTIQAFYTIALLLFAAVALWSGYWPLVLLGAGIVFVSLLRLGYNLDDILGKLGF